jgi:hypothetical protein
MFDPQFLADAGRLAGHRGVRLSLGADDDIDDEFYMDRSLAGMGSAGRAKGRVELTTLRAAADLVQFDSLE